ncbi:hypothetical protein [Maribacter aquivivus]|uniref:hypothetical protein n=1 Tax=Maribacter aquivivus TaxID=228958 RepID=UPI0024911BC5|nr:hypothetical protein [Maribacter aquivivus]
MKYRIHLALSIILLLGFGCGNGKKQIVDYYYIYDYVDFDNNRNRIDGKNVLMCNPAFKNDPFIKDLKFVEWDKSIIIATTTNGHFIIEANSNGLCCGCGNKTKGPLTSKELDNFKNENDFQHIEKIKINQ